MLDKAQVARGETFSYGCGVTMSPSGLHDVCGFFSVFHNDGRDSKVRCGDRLSDAMYPMTQHVW